MSRTVIAALLLLALPAVAQPKPGAPFPMDPNPQAPVGGVAQVTLAPRAGAGEPRCDVPVVSGKPAGPAGLDGVARQLLAHGPMRFAVRVDGRCPVADLREALDKLRAGGATDLSVEVQGENGQLTALALASAQAGAPVGPPSKGAQGAAQASNAFALALFGQLRGKPGNLFFSPTSVAAALAMAESGAAGRTAEELERALHYEGGRDAARAGYGELLARYNALPATEATLSVVNRLWAQKGTPLSEVYLRRLHQSFGAGLEQVDFRQADSARSLINAWVDEHTHGKIPELLSRGAITPSTQFVLTDAVYFLGLWQQPFTPEETKDLPFHPAREVLAQFAPGVKPPDMRPEPEATEQVPTMHLAKKLKVGQANGVRVLELPYGKDGTLALDALLPDDAAALPALEANLGAQLAPLLASLHEQKADVLLPRFRIRSSFDLVAPLQALGVREAFSGGADFSEMTKAKGFSISGVIHQAFVEVNEKGTEAAAATAVITSRMLDRSQPFAFHADHPFLFLVRDTATGGVLFLGRVADPRAG